VGQAFFLSAGLDESHPVGLRIARTGTWLVSRLTLAMDSESRRRGLLGRASLDPGEGLVIAPSQGVHTFGMAFPIDVVGLTRDGRVTKIRGQVPPRRIVLALSAHSILELPGGHASACALRVGDQVTVERVQLP